jgi:LmbE family N-acetylglucosaminyl deacetylase
MSMPSPPMSQDSSPARNPEACRSMKALCIHAHFDDYEFVVSGTYELWRRKLGKAFRGRVIVCTDGEAGHHFRPRAETGRLRLQEQEASARIGGYEFELLRLRQGEVPREGAQQVTPDFLAALWKDIRDFEPDYLFCPPLPTDPLAGVHSDHLVVAEAIRRVAYLINVPHAFTPEYPAEETQSRPCKVPVILNVYDGYMFGANAFDFAVDVSEVFPTIAEMSWCHQSQIKEWLPWVGRHQMAVPASFEEWSQTLRRRFERKNRELGLRVRHPLEVFTVTAWGEIPTGEELERDFPNLCVEASNLEGLKARLAKWKPPS